MLRNQKVLRLDLNDGQKNIFTEKGLSRILRGCDLQSYAREADLYNLKSRIAGRHSVSLDNLVFVNGSYHALDLIFSFLVKDGDDVVLPVPSFAFYGKFEKNRKIHFSKIKYLENCQLPVAKILMHLSGKTKLVYLVNPNNPLGSVSTPNELEIIIKAALLKNIMVVVDEAYLEYVGEEFSVIKLISKYKNLIVLRSFSKIGMSGLKLGYIISNPKLSKMLEEIRGDIYNVNKASICLVSHILEDKNFMSSYVDEISKSKKKLIAFLNSRNVTILPSKSNFVTAKFFDNVSFCSELKNRNILVKDLSHYPDAPAWLRTFVRITVPNKKDVARLVKILTDVMDKFRAK